MTRKHRTIATPPILQGSRHLQSSGGARERVTATVIARPGEGRKGAPESAAKGQQPQQQAGYAQLGRVGQEDVVDFQAYRL